MAERAESPLSLAATAAAAKRGERVQSSSSDCGRAAAADWPPLHSFVVCYQVSAGSRASARLPGWLARTSKQVARREIIIIPLPLASARRAVAVVVVVAFHRLEYNLAILSRSRKTVRRRANNNESQLNPVSRRHVDDDASANEGALKAELGRAKNLVVC